MSSPKLTRTHWLIIIIASIGFLFDTYELLMTPLAAPPALAEFLKPRFPNPFDLENNITLWVGRLLWMSALCGGVFGLLGGRLIDTLGRKRVMAGSILVYSLSPVFAAFSTSLEMFVFFRCTTFIGVCVEFVAAVTWVAEMFEDKTQRARWLGITLAFASVGGVLVTRVNGWLIEALRHAGNLPVLGLPLAGDSPGAWRYLLLTGLLPAIPIVLLLPFVPESRVWREKRAAGKLTRPSIRALFSPELRRVTLLTAALSACAYGIAFGTLQVTVSRAVGALPELKEQAKTLGKLGAEAAALSKDLSGKKNDPAATEEILTKIKKNVADQKSVKAAVQKKGTEVQFFQEMGGLLGRIALAGLLFIGLSRRSILRIFQFPALVAIPIAYFVLFPKGGDPFFWAYGLCGFFTIAQFSYFGEYLPKVFPLHLRGTGGSFATNVGGRMIGTSAALLTTSVIAPLFAVDPQKVLPQNVATAAGWVGAVLAFLALILGYLLPEPKDDPEA